MVEQRPFKPFVLGSSPRSLTKKQDPTISWVLLFSDQWVLTLLGSAFRKTKCVSCPRSLTNLQTSIKWPYPLDFRVLLRNNIIVMSRSTSILNISVTPEEETQIEELAKSQSTSKSALVREALRVYRLNKNLDVIRDIGNRTATAQGIDSYEDIERIAG